MSTLAFFGLAVVLTITSVHSSPELRYSYTDENYGITWMYFSDGDGNPRFANLTTPDYDNFENADKPINFELYTREHQSLPITIRAHSFEDFHKFDSYFLRPIETKIIIHGWYSNTQSDSVRSIKDAYLRSRLCNIIAVNWEDSAASIWYITSAIHTKVVGQYTAELIYYLHKKRGVSFRSFHIIGHSLGGHAAGYAGALVNGKVARISGLDPAMPWFLTVTTDDRLDPSDAEFVDVIHTCGGVLGLILTLGTVDFYPNGGTIFQPGCSGWMEFIEACSHARAHKLFAESIETKKGFYGHQCASYEHMETKKCSEKPSVLMGDQVPLSARGVLYLLSNAAPPYAKGEVLLETY